MEHFHILALSLELRIEGKGSTLPNLKKITLEKEIHMKTIKISPSLHITWCGGWGRGGGAEKQIPTENCKSSYNSRGRLTCL